MRLRDGMEEGREEVGKREGEVKEGREREQVTDLGPLDDLAVDPQQVGPLEGLKAKVVIVEVTLKPDLVVKAVAILLQVADDE